MSIKQEEQRKIAKIGSKIEEGLKEKLVNCLQSYANVFAWSHEDMSGIDPMIAYHKSDIKKDIQPVKQKRMCFHQERYNATSTEVEKLL